VLRWDFIKLFNNSSNKGLIPKWYISLQNNITTNGYTLNDLYRKIPWQYNNINITNNISNDKRKKEWCCSFDTNENIIWGKILKKLNNTSVLIQYYIITSNSKLETSTLLKCEGCKKNTSVTDHKCIIKIKKRESLEVKLTKKKTNNMTNKLNIPCNPYTIESLVIHSLKKHTSLISKEFSTFKSDITIEIEVSEIEQINKLVSSNTHREEIINKFLENKDQRKYTPNNLPSYEFFTDSFLPKGGKKKSLWEQHGFKPKVPILIVTFLRELKTDHHQPKLN